MGSQNYLSLSSGCIIELGALFQPSPSLVMIFFPLKVSTVTSAVWLLPWGEEMELREMGEEISQCALLGNHVF